MPRLISVYKTHALLWTTRYLEESHTRLRDPNTWGRITVLVPQRLPRLALTVEAGRALPATHYVFFKKTLLCMYDTQHKEQGCGVISMQPPDPTRHATRPEKQTPLSFPVGTNTSSSLLQPFRRELLDECSSTFMAQRP